MMRTSLRFSCKLDSFTAISFAVLHDKMWFACSLSTDEIICHHFARIDFWFHWSQMFGNIASHDVRQLACIRLNFSNFNVSTIWWNLLEPSRMFDSCVDIQCGSAIGCSIHTHTIFYAKTSTTLARRLGFCRITSVFRTFTFEYYSITTATGPITNWKLSVVE